MLVLSLLAGASLAADGTPVDPAFAVLTNTPRSATNFNVETIRGMAFDTTQAQLFAINTHGSTLVMFDATSVTKPVNTFRTLNNPSALALWDDPSTGGRFAIVVGGGTHGVVKQNRDTGDIVKYLPLPSEPMDVVVDSQLQRAYVSCAGAFDNAAGQSGGVVMRIDLTNGNFAFAGGTPAGSGQHFIDGARPSFLNIEMGPNANDNFVFVTPMLSGNNTTHQLFGFDEEVVSCTGLPDNDLFSINEQGAVSVVLSARPTANPPLPGAGTLLTAHKRNPATGEYWILNVESLNAAQHTEPAHRGQFAQNRVTIAVPINPSNPNTFSTWAAKGLDVATVPGQAAPLLLPGSPASNGDKPVSFPFGLDFHSSGLAAVVSSTGDMLRILDASGNTVRNMELAEGSIPRGVLLSPDGALVFVYAWGLNKIFEYGTGDLIFGSSAKPLKAFELGADPASVAVKRGRQIWYDADNSQDANGVRGKVSCNTCHPRGGMDMLGWDLGNPPLDRKDTMVTQSLIGIEDTFPYHWRGERTLAEFNQAFSGLLGGTDLNADDLDAFQAFVFSLAPPANPRENIDRVLDQAHVVRTTSGNPPVNLVGSAVNGQTAFFGEQNSLTGFLPVTCAQCHGGEGGTDGLITQDILSRLPTNGSLDVAHLRQLQHKFFQPLVQNVTVPLHTSPPSTALVARPRGGFGFSQDGSDNDIMDFLSQIFFPLVGTRTQLQQDQLRVDTATFTLQFDQGIAPRAHTATLFDQATSSLPVVQTMIGQAAIGWIDIAMVGKRRNTAGTMVAFEAFYDAAAQLFFTAEPLTTGSQSFTLTTLEGDRAANNLAVLVVGLPPGNAFRWAVDPDDDGASTLLESQFSAGNPPRLLDPLDADTDDDGFLDGYERLFFPTIDPTLVNNAAQVAGADGAVPTMTLNGTDFVSGRVSKHFVTFSEPVTYDVQPLREFPIGSGVFSAFGPLQRHKSLCRKDTLDGQGLLPSISVPNGTATSTRIENFRLKVTMRDSAGNTNAQFIPGPTSSFSPRNAVFASNAPTVQGFQLAFAGRTNNTFTFNVNIDDIWRSATPPLPANENNKTVVFQLVSQQANGTFAPLPIANLTGSLGTRVTPDFTIGNQVGNPAVPVTVLYYPGKVPGVPLPWVPANTNPFTSVADGELIPGPFILAPLTGLVNGSGDTTVNVTVNPPPSAGTPARLVILGAFTELTAQPPPAPQVDFLGSPVFFYQLPMTAESLRMASFTF